MQTECSYKFPRKKQRNLMFDPMKQEHSRSPLINFFFFHLWKTWPGSRRLLHNFVHDILLIRMVFRIWNHFPTLLFMLNIWKQIWMKIFCILLWTQFKEKIEKGYYEDSVFCKVLQSHDFVILQSCNLVILQSCNLVIL